MEISKASISDWNFGNKFNQKYWQCVWLERIRREVRSKCFHFLRRSPNLVIKCCGEACKQTIYKNAAWQQQQLQRKATARVQSFDFISLSLAGAFYALSLFLSWLADNLLSLGPPPPPPLSTARASFVNQRVNRKVIKIIRSCFCLLDAIQKVLKYPPCLCRSIR